MHVWVGLSDNFKKKLLSLDKYLKATFDVVEDAIIIWSERVNRPKQHEFTSRRTFYTDHEVLLDASGDPIQVKTSLQMPELEQWTIKKLIDIDTWQRHGDGKSFDDWLNDQEESQRAMNKRIFERERMSMNKENHDEWAAAIWNAQNGRYTDATAQPYEVTKRINVPTTFKKG